MVIYIYILKDPTNDQIRYVGKSVNPVIRCRKHISEAKNSNLNNHRVNWIKSLLKKGLKPKVEVIDEIIGDWEWLEEYWIWQLKTWGFNLTNSTSGGENPPSWKGKTHSDEYKEIRRIIMIKDNPSKNMTDEWKKNISLAHKKNGFLPTKATEANKRKVHQFDLDGNFIKIWDSLTEAASNSGLKNISGIREVCLGRRFKSGNFRWSFTNKIIENKND